MRTCIFILATMAGLAPATVQAQFGGYAGGSGGPYVGPTVTAQASVNYVGPASAPRVYTSAPCGPAVVVRAPLFPRRAIVYAQPAYPVAAPYVPSYPSYPPSAAQGVQIHQAFYGGAGVGAAAPCRGGCAGCPNCTRCPNGGCPRPAGPQQAYQGGIGAYAEVFQGAPPVGGCPSGNCPRSGYR